MGINDRLPAAFRERMEELLGADGLRFFASYASEAERALFVPAGRCSAFERVCPFPVERIPYLPGAYRFDCPSPGNQPLHHAGAFYVQDPSAMATVSAAPLRLGMKCLDLCAAPGGKSVQLASGIGCYDGGTGFLVSNEIQPARCKVLCGNLERMGFANLLVTNADAKRISAWYPSYFDLVLVDAPCSGEGMFRKDPAAIAEWSPSASGYCAKRQAMLLAEAAKTVAPGGYLLYSTCTFAPAENEQVVLAFLDAHPSFAPCDVPEALCGVTVSGVGLPSARRWYPHIAPGEGQFFALLRRTPDGEPVASLPFPDARLPLTAEEAYAVQEFLADTLLSYADLSLCAFGRARRIAVCPFPVPPENVFAAGVTLGTVEKGRLVPHHQFFKAFSERFLRKILLSPGDPRVAAYLSGAEIPLDGPASGWGVVTLAGLPLGGAKLSNGVAKNHYPKGLRLHA